MAGISGTVTDFGQADRDDIVPVVTTPGVLEDLACHTEEPGARRREVFRDVVETTPRDKHDVTDNVLGVGRMNAPTNEAEEIDVHRIEDLAEALFALRRRCSDGVHVMFLSGIAQVCRSKSRMPHKHADLPAGSGGRVDEQSSPRKPDDGTLCHAVMLDPEGDGFCAVEGDASVAGPILGVSVAGDTIAS